LLTYSDGKIYNGLFLENKKHGEGYLMFPNGDKYDGNFINDEYEGEGVLTCAEGTITKAFWKKGEAKEELDKD
jgi:hypothetical protein